MGTEDLCIFAGLEDDAVFRAHAKSIGLTLLHPHAYKMTPEENERAFDNPFQGGYFSFLPVQQLHRHPHPEIGLCEALDPLILYVRCGYDPPSLVASNVLWYTTVRELARQTEPYFMRLRRWVKASWRQREEDGYYIGPHAERILEEECAKVAYLPLGATVKRIID